MPSFNHAHAQNRSLLLPNCALHFWGSNGGRPREIRLRCFLQRPSCRTTFGSSIRYPIVGGAMKPAAAGSPVQSRGPARILKLKQCSDPTIPAPGIFESDTISQRTVAAPSAVIGQIRPPARGRSLAATRSRERRQLNAVSRKAGQRGRQGELRNRSEPRQGVCGKSEARLERLPSPPVFASAQCCSASTQKSRSAGRRCATGSPKALHLVAPRYGGV